MNRFISMCLHVLPVPLKHKIMLQMVKQNYAVNDYNEHYRSSLERVGATQEYIINTFIQNLNTKPHILDLGCGNGAMYDRLLVSKGCTITGIDISPRQLESARKLLPEQTFVLGDFVKFKPACTFDGIVSFFSLYNIPRKLHKKVLRNCYKWLTDSGRMLINVRFEEVGDVDYWKDWCGAPLVFSYYSAQAFMDMARSVGFYVTKFRVSHHNEYVWLILSKQGDLPDEM